MGAIAVGLYLFSQEKKTRIAVTKKKAPRKRPQKHDIPEVLRPRPKIKYNKPKIKRVIAKKKAVYNKPKIKKAVAKKKKVYNKPKIKKVVAKKKITLTKPQKKKIKIKYHIPVSHPKRR